MFFYYDLNITKILEFKKNKQAEIWLYKFQNT